MRPEPGRARMGRMAACTVVLASLAAGQAVALQVIDAVDHGELRAEVSSGEVNRIALDGDRIARVVQSSGALTVEHDPVRGDLYLYPRGGAVPGGTAVPEGTATSVGAAARGSAPAHRRAPAPVTLYLGTERGFTYRLSLTAVERGSAQILIRNPAVASNGRGSGPAGTGYVNELVALIGAVARRDPPAGYAIVPRAGGEDDTANGADQPRNVSLLETWRGPRFSARVFSVRGAAPRDASELAETAGPGVAAAWLSPAPGSAAQGSSAHGSPYGDAAGGEDAVEAGRLAVIVEPTVVAEAVR